MEYGPENNIFDLKMMMKSGLEKFFFEIPQCAKPFFENIFFFIERQGGFLHKSANSVIKLTSFAHEGNSILHILKDQSEQKNHPYSILST